MAIFGNADSAAGLQPVTRHIILIIALAAVSVVPVRADDPAPQAGKLTWEATARQIDSLFAATWQQEQITPADIADDEEFIRRVYLDLAGRIPAVSEAREFLESDDPDRRSQVVDQLLQDPAYVRHMTIVWRNALIPQAMSQLEFRGVVPGFDAWLWERLAANLPYDRLVHQIITTDVFAADDAAQGATRADAFFVVRGMMPESLASGTVRSFLGVRLDCAQCHDHPFDKWKQQQFWNIAAFYSGFSRDEDAPDAMPTREARDQRRISIPGTDETVTTVFLTGDSPADESAAPRTQLADWIVDAQNPWFAKMAANRLWAQFFGQGIVHPIDDFSDDNPPSHPQVLQLLADQLVAHDFDLTFLIRAIVGSNVYQRSSIHSHDSQLNPDMFAKAAVRGLSPEQFFDSLAEAVGFYQPYRRENPFVVDDNSPRGRFIELFRSDAESSVDHRTTILQALAMMNGEFVAEATSLQDSRTLRAVTEFPLMSLEERLETLFLAALARRPATEELDVFLDYVRQRTNDEARAAALADVFWALLNSSEFLLNH